MPLRELWSEIEHFPNYLISSEGRLKNRTTGKLLNPSVRGRTSPYLRSNLCVYGCCSTQNIHVLVAEAFIGQVGAGFEVNHIDGNKLNNRVENLEIVTPSQNVIHAYSLGLRKPTNKKVRCIETGEVFDSYKAAAEHLGMSKQYVSMVMRGVVSHAKGYHFEAVE